MILLRIPPLARRDDFRRKRLLIPLLAHFFRNTFCDFVLLVAMRKDGTAILRANIRALSVLGRGIMHAVEEFQQRAIAHQRRVKGDLEGLGICSSTKSASHFIKPRDSKITVHLRPVSPVQTAR